MFKHVSMILTEEVLEKLRELEKEKNLNADELLRFLIDNAKCKEPQ